MQLDEMRQKIRDLEARVSQLEGNEVPPVFGPLNEPKETSANLSKDAIEVISLSVSLRKYYEDTGHIAGIVDCPKCGSTINWSIAEHNKHTRGKCQTSDCLSWIE